MITEPEGKGQWWVVYTVWSLILHQHTQSREEAIPFPGWHVSSVLSLLMLQSAECAFGRRPVLTSGVSPGCDRGSGHLPAGLDCALLHPAKKFPNRRQQ